VGQVGVQRVDQGAKVKVKALVSKLGHVAGDSISRLV
jgi:hypothetical protein